MAQTCAEPSCLWDLQRIQVSRSVADSYDNAMAEAERHVQGRELIQHQGPWRALHQVERAVFSGSRWYNVKWLHSALG